jgi:ABC-type Fe3+ transport system permease subunit
MVGRSLRTALAVVVSPLIGALTASLPLVAWLWFAPSNIVGRQQTNPDLLLFAGQTLFMAAIGSVIAVPLSATLGLATHRILTTTGRVARINYIVAGAIVGLLSGTGLLLAFLPTFFEFSLGSYLPLILWGGGIGAVSGAVAWLIRRPDQNEPAIIQP